MFYHEKMVTWLSDYIAEIYSFLLTGSEVKYCTTGTTGIWAQKNGDLSSTNIR